MSKWLDSSGTSNLLKATYIKGFLDISGGDFITRNGNISIAGDASFNGRLFLGGDASLNGTFMLGGDASLNQRLFVGGQGVFAGDVSANGRLFVSSDVSLGARMLVAGDVSLGGNIYAKYPASSIPPTAIVGGVSLTTFATDVSMNSRLYGVADASFGSRLFVGSDISLGSRLFVSGDVSLGGSFYTKGKTQVAQDVSLNRAFVRNAATIAGKVYIRGDLSLSGNLSYAFPNSSIPATAIRGGISSSTFSGDLSMGARLFLGKDLSMGPTSSMFSANFNAENKQYGSAEFTASPLVYDVYTPAVTAFNPASTFSATPVNGTTWFGNYWNASTVTTTEVTPGIIAMSSTGQYIMDVSNGLWLSTNYGVNWTKNSGFTANQFSSVALNGNGQTAIVADTQSGLYYTSTGTQWTQSQGLVVPAMTPVWVAVGYSTPNTIAYSTNGKTWTGLGASIFSGEAFGVAHNGLSGNDSRFVAVGYGTNTIAYSYNGQTWTGLGKPILSDSASGIAHNGLSGTNGLWVAGGNGTSYSLAYSYDGQTWTGATNSKSIFSNQGMGVAYNGLSGTNGRWVAVGQGTNAIAYSSNGQTWTGKGTSIFSQYGRGVAHNGQSGTNGRWVAVGSGGTHSIAYSYDGETWTGLGLSIFTLLGFGVAHNQQSGTNGLWVAAGRDTNTLAYSYDGITWVGLGKSIISGVGQDVVYNGQSGTNGLWVAAGRDADTLAYSYNGITWTGAGTGTTALSGVAFGVTFGLVPTFVSGPITEGQWSSVVMASTQAIAASTGSGLTGVYYSTNAGQFWTPSNVTTGSVSALALNSNKAVVSTTGSGLYYSTNAGAQWTQSQALVPVIQPLWVSIGTGGTTTIAYSTNGRNWTGVPNSNSILEGESGVAHNGLSGTNGLWVGVGTGGIAYSYNGQIWTRISPSVIGAGKDIAYNREHGSNGLWVAVGGFGNSIAYSSDGIKWTGVSNSLSTIESAYSVAYNGQSGTNGRWVAVGYTVNSIAYSYNGKIWTGISGSLALIGVGMSVAHNKQSGTNGIWVATAYGGTYPFAYSYDGQIWTGVSATGVGGRDIAHNGLSGTSGLWITVGPQSSYPIAYSTNGVNWTGVANSATIFAESKKGWGAGHNGLSGTNGLWVVGGEGNVGHSLAYSYDGKIWTGVPNSNLIFVNGGYCAGFGYNSFLVPINITEGQWSSISLSSSQAIAASNGSGFTGLYYSTNAGQLWEQSQALVQVIPQFLVAVGEGANKIAYSYDGTIWTGTGTSIFSTRGWGVAHNQQSGTNSMWVAVGEGTTTIAYSYNGKTWTGATNSTSIFSSGKKVAYNGQSGTNGLWVVVGEGTNSIATSTDGQNWTGLGKSIFPSSGYYVAHNGQSGTNGRWVAVGGGVTVTNSIAYSYDGIVWTGLGKTIFSTEGIGVAHNGFSGTSGRWVAGGWGTNTIAYSYDGITWTGRGNIMFTYNGWGVAHNGQSGTNGLWVMGGTGTNTLVYSPDGQNWTGLGNTIFPGNGFDVTHNRQSGTNGLWSAVGDTNKFAYSYDGKNWTSTTTSIVSTARGVTFGYDLVPVLVPALITEGQWSAVAISSTQSIAASNGSGFTGIYYSTNSGQLWTQSNVNDLSFGSVAISSTGQYAIACPTTSGQPVYYSTNYGQSWRVSTRNSVSTRVTMSASGDLIVASPGPGQSAFAFEVNQVAPTIVSPSVPYLPISRITVKKDMSVRRLFVGADVSFSSNVYIVGDLSLNGRMLMGFAPNSIASSAVIGGTYTSYFTNDVSMNSRLFVGGDVSLGRLFISGDVSLNSRLFAGGDVSLGGALYVSPDTTILNTASVAQRLFVGGDASFSRNVYVQGKTSIMTADLSLNARIFTSGDASFNQNLYVSKQFAVTAGDISFGTSARLFVGGDASFNRNIFVASDVSLNARALIAGDASFAGRLIVTGDISMGQRVFVSGDMSLNSRLYVGGDLAVGGEFNHPLFSSKSSRNSINTNPAAFFGVGTTAPNFALDVSGTSTVAPLRVAIGSTVAAIVDASGRVGFNTNAPAYALDVSGSTLFRRDVTTTRVYVKDDVSMSGRLVMVAGDASFNSRLFIEQDASFNGRINGAARDASFNGNVYVARDVFVYGNTSIQQYTAQSMVTSLSYDFIVNQDLSLNGRISAKNDIMVDGRIYMTGADASFGGNLFVASTSTFNGDISMNRRLFMVGDASFGARIFVGSTTIIGGDVSANARLFVSGDASLTGNLYVGSGTVVNGDMSLNARLFTNDDISFNGNLGIGSNAIFVGDVSANSRLFIGGDASFGGNLEVLGNYIVPADLSTTGRVFVGGDVSFNGNLFVQQLAGDVNTVGRAFISGDASINSIEVAGTTIIPTDVDVSTLLQVDLDLSMSAAANVYTPNFEVASGLTKFYVDVSLNSGARLFANNIIANTIVGDSISIYSLNYNNIYVSGDTSMNARLFVGGDASLNNRLFLSGDLSLGGNLTVAGGMSVLSGDVSMNSRLFIVNDGSFGGNVFVGGALISAGDVSANSRLFMSGDTSFNGNLFIGQVATMAADVSMTNARFIVADDVSLGGNLASTGLLVVVGDLSGGTASRLFVGNDVSFTGLVSIQNALVAAADVSGNGNLRIGTDMSMSGNLTVATTTLFTGDVSLNSRLFVGGLTTIAGNVAVGKVTIAGKDATISGRAFVGADVSINGNLFAPTTLDCSGDLSMNSHMFIGGDASLNGDLFLSGSALFAGDLSSARLFVGGDATVLGNVFVQNLGEYRADVSMGAGRVFVGGDVSMAGDVFVSGNIVYNRDIMTNQVVLTNDAFINGVRVGLGPGSIETNAIIGGNALSSNTTGANLVAIGLNAGAANSTGSNNTYLGADTTTTGAFSQSTAIGRGATITGSNQVMVSTKAIPMGDATIGGRLFLAGAVVTTGNIYVAGSQQYLGDVSANSRLFVGSDASLGRNLFAAGNATLGGRLLVTNSTANSILNTFVSSYSVLAISEDVSANNRLYVAGDISMGSRLFVAGRTLVSGDLSANARVFVSGNIRVGGNVMVGGNVFIAGSQISNTGIMGPTGPTGPAGPFTTLFVGDLNGQRRVFVSGDVSMSGNLFVGGKTQIIGDLSANGRLFLARDLSINRNVTVLGSVMSVGDVSAKSRLFVGTDASLAANLVLVNKTVARYDVSLGSRVFIGKNTSVGGSLVAKDVALKKNTIMKMPSVTVPTFDLNSGSTFYYTPSAGTNFAAAFVNVPTTVNKTVRVTIYINSSTHKVYGSTYSVNGGSSTAPLFKGTPNVAGAGSMITQTFEIIRTSGGVNVLSVVGAANGFAVVSSASYVLVTHANPVWSPLGSPAYNGLNGAVNATCFNADRTKLFVGGAFTAAYDASNVNGIIAARVAQFDVATSTWSSIGSGVNNTVNTLEFDNSNNALYVGGTFTAANNGGIGILAYNVFTNSVSPFGNNFTNGQINAFEYDISNGFIYVGGNFTTVTDSSNTSLSANYVAKWSLATSTWSRFGTSTSNGTNTTVSSLALDASNQSLYVGGFFFIVSDSSNTSLSANYVAKWSLATSTWSLLGTAASNGTGSGVRVLALDASNQSLYFGGGFTTVSDSSSTNLSVNRVAKWSLATSTWSRFGIDASNGTNDTVGAFALDASNQSLYIGGEFTTVTDSSSTNLSANRVAKWSLATSTWSRFGTAANNGTNSVAYALALDTSNQSLYVGGLFTGVSDSSSTNLSAKYVAKWSLATSTWSRFGTAANNGTNNTVRALALDASNQSLYVGGDFTTVSDSSSTNLSANYVAKWSLATSTWSRIGTAANNGVGSIVNALAFDASNQSLYIGGSFNVVVANYVAKWSLATSTWSPFGTSTSNGTNNGVFSLAFDSSNQSLYVGGTFTTVSDSSSTNLSANRVAKWSLATSTWSKFGVDASNGTNNTVRALALDASNQSLYVGGVLTTVSDSSSTNLSAKYIAKWSLATSTWSQFGTAASNGTGSIVNALAFDASNQSLYIGGDFTTVSDSSSTNLSANSVAKWSLATSTWSRFGTSASNGTDASVTALAFDSSNQSLYVGGGFTRVSDSSSTNLSARRVAKWSLATSTWSRFGTSTSNGTNTTVSSLALDASNQSLYVGGNFTTVSDSVGTTLSANYVAKWSRDALVNIPTPKNLTATPANQSVSIKFTISGTVTNYQYSIDNGATFTPFSPAQTTSPVTITGLTNGQSYNIALKLVTAEGVGLASNIVSVTPAVTSAPSAPTGLSGTFSNTNLSVSFSPGSSGGLPITNYKYSLNGGSSFTAFSPSRTTSPLVITGLTTGQSYSVVLKAVNAIGDGANSTVLSIST